MKAIEGLANGDEHQEERDDDREDEERRERHRCGPGMLAVESPRGLGQRASRWGTAMNTVVPFRRPALTVGEKVAYQGPELSIISLWSGHPGTVALVEFDPLAGYTIPWVEFFRGPILDLDPRDLKRLDVVSFHRRIRRLDRGQHPLEDRDVLVSQPAAPPE